jgi:hypothetical protein
MITRTHHVNCITFFSDGMYLAPSFLRGSAPAGTESEMHMLGRVYTFERDAAADVLPQHDLVSQAAIDAIVAAINEQPGVRYEELTDFENAKPVFAVNFANPVCMDHFDRFIEATLKLGGVRIAAMQEYYALHPSLVAPARANASRGNDMDAYPHQTPRAA